MITVKQWKELNNFEPIKDDILDIDGTIAMIAMVRGKDTAEIEENTAVDELLPEFLACVREVNGSVFAKLNQLPKNVERDGK